MVPVEDKSIWMNSACSDVHQQHEFFIGCHDNYEVFEERPPPSHVYPHLLESP